MGKTINQKHQIVFACNECKMKYHNEETAKKCEEWCKRTKSCNMDIIKYAIKDSDKKLIFVYNADSDTLSMIKDMITKVVAPKSYQCNLCAITYGPLSMKDRWRKFLDTLPQEKIFLHKDEFQTKYPKQKDTTLPAIFIEDNDELITLVSSSEINVQNNLSQLEGLIKGRLK